MGHQALMQFHTEFSDGGSWNEAWSQQLVLSFVGNRTNEAQGFYFPVIYIKLVIIHYKTDLLSSMVPGTPTCIEIRESLSVLLLLIGSYICVTAVEIMWQCSIVKDWNVLMSFFLIYC